MNNENLVCPICSEPTRVYMGKARKDRLCGKHADMLKAGELVLNEQGYCINATTVKEQAKEETVSDLTCIICGENSNGKHFCYKCYRQFSKKVLYIQVKKCTEFTKLEAEYESDFTCEDGHLVKSPYEKIIDDYLYREGIKHAYEKKIDIDETHDITPDFFIPEYNGIKNIYVEFWGYGEENIEYTRRKEYKTNLYPTLVTKENISVVYLNKKDVETDNFKKKIKYAKQGEIKE